MSTVEESLVSLERKVMQVADERNELLRTLKTALHALRSYEHGNSSPDLAAEAATHIERVIQTVTEGH